MRNNEDRIPQPQKSNDVPPKQEMAKPFEFPAFTDEVELPSKGQFYDESHPLHKVDRTEVFFMSSKEEDILTSETLLKKGLMFDKLISNVIKDKRIQSRSLLDADRAAILISVRKTGLGVEYPVVMPCPSCLTKNNIDSNLDSDVVVNESQKHWNDVGVEKVDDDKFSYTMDMRGFSAEIVFKLMSGIDENELFKNSEQAKKQKGHETNFTDKLKQIVVSVNGNTEKKYVHRFCEVMPYMFAQDLLKVYRSIAPSVKIKTHMDCKNSDCEFSGLVEVPITKNFFWPEL